MMKFNTTEIDLGSLNENKSYSASFSYTGEPSDIKLTASCGCVDVKWDRDNHAVKFTVKTSSVPQHLKEMGRYVLAKTIIVWASFISVAPENHVLVIKGIVHK